MATQVSFEELARTNKDNGHKLKEAIRFMNVEEPDLYDRFATLFHATPDHFRLAIVGAADANVELLQLLAYHSFATATEVLFSEEDV